MELTGKRFDIGHGIIVVVEKVNPAEVVCRDETGTSSGKIRTISLHKFTDRLASGAFTAA